MTTGVLSIACVIGGCKVNTKRNAVLTTAYKLSETAFTDYREKVVETIGEKKEEEIHAKVAKKKLDETISTEGQYVWDTGHGNSLCYDCMTGRLFRSDIDFMRRTVNQMNQRLNVEMYMGLNELYYELGLKPVRLGNDLGWNRDNGLIEVRYDPILTDEDKPCIAISYDIGPRYDYRTLS